MIALPSTIYDYILVGGGLQSGLICLALRHYQPDCTVLILERSNELGGNHTWCSYGGDVSSREPWCAPLFQCEWPGYWVHFPGFQRYVPEPYRCTTSEHFASVIRSHTMARANDTRPPLQIETGTEVTAVDASSVWTASRRTFQARAVIDCRGPLSGEIRATRLTGFQKFFGMELALDRPWPASSPIVMDARGPQFDGYRFFYVLPLSSRRVLVEETFFSDDPALDQRASAKRIAEYVQRVLPCSWQIVREEAGCLPMPYDASHLPQATSPLTGGYAGGWFHAATGYSFPLAVQFAAAVATTTPELAEAAISRLANDQRARALQARWLNRMLFRLVRPDCRWQIFRRFYRVMRRSSLSRFYSHQFTRADLARIVFGWPPAGLTPVRFFTASRS